MPENDTRLIELQNSITESESALNIKPGCDKKIIWFNGPALTKTAIVSIHGFGSSRMEMFPLYDRIAQSIGANLFYARLAGHGTTDDDALLGISHADWISDVVEAIETGLRIADRIILTAHSFGASAALKVLLDNPDLRSKITAFIVTSPNYRVPVPFYNMPDSPLTRRIAKLIIGKYRVIRSANPDIKKYWSTRQRAEGIFEMIRLQKLIDYKLLPELTVPHCMIYTGSDKLIRLRDIFRVFVGMGSPYKYAVNLPGATRHTFAGDILAPSGTGQCVKIILDFLSKCHS